MNANSKLTEHFTLGEMTASSSHPEVKNTPSEAAIENLKRVCSWLEDLRREFNIRYITGKEKPLHINSGYRSTMLNKVIGGSPTSNHLTGCAADIRCSGRLPQERAMTAIQYANCLLGIAEKRGETFDELIIERLGTSWWVHFAVRPSGNRMKITIISA